MGSRLLGGVQPYVRIVAALTFATAAVPALAAPSPEAELKQLERDYAKALINRDLNFLRDFYAPDWRGGDWMGFASKTIIMNMLKNQRYVVRSMTLHDMKVRVFGDLAIVQGVDEEITSMGGKDTSGTWGFTDIFVKRSGRWAAIASQTTKIERKR
jgi:ketosteroid isomerase-like protein